MQNLDINWDNVYREAKSIIDVPWETNKPSKELSYLISEGKIEPCKTLDIGCGFGTHAIFMSQKGFDVTALDISERAIEVAKERAKKQYVNSYFFVGDINEVNITNKFEFVFDRGCFHVLNNSDREKYIENVHRILEPGGKYYLEVFSEKNQPGPGPSRFSKQEIEKYFASYFTILQIKEIIHVETSRIRFIPGSNRYMYSILMEKI